MSKSRRQRKIAARNQPTVGASELRRKFTMSRQGVQFDVAPVKGAGLFLVQDGRVNRHVQFSPA